MEIFERKNQEVNDSTAFNRKDTVDSRRFVVRGGTTEARSRGGVLPHVLGRQRASRKGRCAHTRRQGISRAASGGVERASGFAQRARVSGARPVEGSLRVGRLSRPAAFRRGAHRAGAVSLFKGNHANPPALQGFPAGDAPARLPRGAFGHQDNRQDKLLRRRGRARVRKAAQESRARDAARAIGCARLRRFRKNPLAVRPPRPRR